MLWACSIKLVLDQFENKYNYLFNCKVGWTILGICEISGIISDEIVLNCKEETISSVKDLSLGERLYFQKICGNDWSRENANYAKRKLNCLCK